MIRRVIQINEALCNGCGQCIPNCPEGALKLIDGKARLVSSIFCDGLGACIGNCPQNAIAIVEEEADAYNETLVMGQIAPQGANVIAAHLKHLQDHGETALYEEALAYLKSHQIAIPPGAAAAPAPTPAPADGCPGSLMRQLQGDNSQAEQNKTMPSALRQWPIQLKLINSSGAYFDQADLLISADCAAYACGGFHPVLLAGKILIIFCPKLDGDVNGYVDKLAEIFSRHAIRSITIARMEVPCCGGTEVIVRKAMERSGQDIPIQCRVVAIDGSVR